MFRWLRFKKLHEFNMAMVGKHAWRLLSNPDSLVTRLLKAKCFPHLNYSGACGRGSSISIWPDSWLYSKSSMKVATPRPIGTDLLLVSYLIHGGHWRSDIINANFLEEDRNAILKIRLSRGQRDDNWFWRLDQKGNILLRALINFLLLYHQFLFNMISAPCGENFGSSCGVYARMLCH